MVINDNTNAAIDLKINNVAVERVNEIKYLGVVVDKKLTFKNHINYICSKISKKVYFLYKSRKKLSLSAAIKIYNTTIKPHFEYCSSILFMANKTDKSRLQKLQNRAMRVILKVSNYTSIKFMLESLQWLSINQRLIMNILILVYKMKNKNYPSYLCDRLVYNNEIHNYDLRNLGNFRLDLYRNEKAKNILLYNGLKLFNELPCELRNETNLNRYKKNLVKHIRNKFE